MPRPRICSLSSSAEAEPDDEFEAVGDDHEHDRCSGRPCEARPVEQVAEIGQPDPFAGIADDAAGEGDEDRVEERVGDEPEAAEQDGEHQGRYPQSDWRWEKVSRVRWRTGSSVGRLVAMTAMGDLDEGLGVRDRG